MQNSRDAKRGFINFVAGATTETRARLASGLSIIDHALAHFNPWLFPNRVPFRFARRAIASPGGWGGPSVCAENEGENGGGRKQVSSENWVATDAVAGWLAARGWRGVEAGAEGGRVFASVPSGWRAPRAYATGVTVWSTLG